MRFNSGEIFPCNKKNTDKPKKLTLRSASARHEFYGFREFVPGKLLLRKLSPK